MSIPVPVRYTPPIQITSARARANSLKSPRSPASPFDPLLSALSTAQARYTISNAQSLKAHTDACHDFPGGNTRTVLHSSPFPLTFVKGEGCELISLDGDTYVDFLGEFTAGLFGHSNKVIAAAVAEAMKSGWNYGGPNVYERKLAAKVTKRFSPAGLELVRFTNSGTEANTMAIAAAKAFTGRTKVLVFKNGYHGGTLSFPPTLREVNTNLSHDFIVAPYNDISGTRAIFSGLPKDALAAVIVEPIQGSGGCIVGQPEFLQYLNATAHAHGALFIVDEVMTSRLAYHGFSAELGLRPDLITLGKWVGGGMTFGAFGGRRNGGIMSMFDPGSGLLSHSGTFNNNIVTMAAGCAGIDIYNEGEVRRLNDLGADMKAGIENVLAKYKIPAPIRDDKPCPEKHELESPFIGTPSSPITSSSGLNFQRLILHDSESGMWISGQGSMLNIHFSGESEKSLLSLFWHHMLDNGIYIAQRGFMALNMELNSGHIEKFIMATESFVSKHRQALGA